MSTNFITRNLGTWQTWTAAHTNITVGNGSVTAKYIKVGRLVYFYYTFILGSTSSITTAPAISLPVTASSDYYTSVANVYLGVCNNVDTGTGAYAGMTRLLSTTTFRPTYYIVAGSLIGPLSISGTAPHTWAATDEIHCEGEYVAA